MNSPPTGSRSLLRIDALFSLRSFLIGVVPLLAVLAVMGGSLAAALQMLLVSTICTLGIGGFFWVGAAMLFGAVLPLLVPRLRAKPVPAFAAAAGPEQAMFNLLVNYASAKLGQGASGDGVRRDLRRNGWSEPQAEAAVAQARSLLAATVAGAGPGGNGDGG